MSILLVILLSLSCAVLTFQKEINTNGDNAAYITLAKSLAQGEGFRFISSPDKERNEAFPLGYPLFLSLFIRLFGFHLFLLKGVMVGVYTLCMLLFLLLARRMLEGKYLAAALLLSITNYWLLDNASINMSELFYMLFVLAGLLFFQTFSEKGGSLHLGIACALMVLSIFVRSVGIAFLLALILFLIYHKRYIFSVVVFAGYFVLNTLHKPLLANPDAYFSVLFMKDPYQPYLGMWTLGEFVARVKYNIVFYLGNVIQMTLLSFMSDMQSLSPGMVIGFSVLIAGLLLAYPYKRILTAKFDLFLRGAIIIYMGVLMVRPEVWSGSRFIVPLIPLFFLMALQNLAWLETRFLKAEYAAKAQKLILAVSIIWSLLNFGEAYRKSHTPLTQDWVDYLSMAGWVRENTDTSAVFCARSPYIFYLKSDRRCVGIPVKPSTAESIQYLEKYRIRYVVIDQFKWTGSTQKYVVPLLREYPNRFTPVKSEGKEGASIYRFNP